MAVSKDHRSPNRRIRHTTKKKKKLTIKNFVSPVSPANFQSSSWSQLEAALCLLFSDHHQPSSVPSLEVLYQTVHNLCSIGAANETCQKLSEFVRDHVINELYAKQFQQQVEQGGDVNFLQKMHKCWLDFCVTVQLIQNVFLPLERYYHLKDNNGRVVNITAMALDHFVGFLVLVQEVFERLCYSLLNCINTERQCHLSLTPHHSLIIANTLRMLVKLSVYDVFESRFLEETRKFYSNEAEIKLNELATAKSFVHSMITYLVFVEAKLQEENTLVVALGFDNIDSGQLTKLTELLQNELIEKRIVNILPVDKFSSLEPLFDEPDQLKLVYKLVSTCQNSTTKLVACFVNWIKYRGKCLLGSTEPSKLVDQLVLLKTQIDKLILECFNTDQRFVSASKNAFDCVLNCQSEKLLNLISQFVDYKLCDTKGGHCEEALDKAILLFRPLNGKDHFKDIYQDALAKRLISGKAASTDAEKMMLDKLRKVCGTGYTSKLYTMLKDIDQSSRINEQFNKSTIDQQLATSDIIDLNVKVLTSGIWPNFGAALEQLNIPTHLSRVEQAFEKFYHATQKRRTLHWMRQFSACLVIGKFGDCTKELETTLLQAIVLLQFNYKHDHTYLELKKLILLERSTNFEQDQLRNTVQSLACGQVCVLVKCPKGSEVADSDRFEVNQSFEHPQHRIKLSCNVMQYKKSDQENGATSRTTEQVKKDRTILLDAAVVRIMKLKKRCSHQELHETVRQKVTFIFSSEDFGKCIHSLVHREYIKYEDNQQQQSPQSICTTDQKDTIYIYIE